MSFQKLLTISNITNTLGASKIISIVGADQSLSINPNSSSSVDLADVQFDELFMDTLYAYKTSGYITVVFEGDSLTATDDLGAVIDTCVATNSVISIPDAFGICGETPDSSSTVEIDNVQALPSSSFKIRINE